MNTKRWYMLIGAALLITIILTNVCFVHDWADAACEMPQICRKCGQTRGESLGGHKWADADCLKPAVCTVCGETVGTPKGHSFAEADCEEARTCTVCGYTEGEALGHDWIDADCITPKTCRRCGLTVGEALDHDWLEAACETAKTCARCGLTEGEALGHDWIDADCITPVTCTRCGAQAGSARGHSYLAADCVTPKTCSVCGEIEGEALGHSWQEASCTLSEICSVCGLTRGEALGHSWQAATCTQAETCARCGLTEGEALGHKLGGKWEPMREELLEETIESKRCIVCGEAMPVLTEDDWQYVVLGESVTIVGNSGSRTELIIPRSIEGLPVTGIGDLAFIRCTDAESISIPRCVVDLGANPFAGLKAEILLAEEHPSLELQDGVLYDIRTERLISYPAAAETAAFEIPEGTLILGDYAFLKAEALRSIRIPDSVTTVGQDPFALTTAQLQVSAGNPLLTVTDGVLFEKPSKRLVHYPASNRDRTYAIPSGILAVDDMAFAMCRNLSVITIPDSVTVIGDMTFMGCTGLTDLTLPDSVAALGEMAFADCSSLKSVRLPDGLPAIGFAALSGCSSLESILIPGSVTVIADGAFFNCTGLTKLTIPETVTDIGSGAFTGCEDLRITVTAGSPAERYCEDNSIRYEYPADMSWLG